ncbi:adenine-specific DNA-methyltransferase [Rhodospirillales bacterium URHD0017]|nr:adenine-specific DNA-methyltransferase [Rhodospirillales bacterium URHD0017]
MSKTKLELTWVGKEYRPRLEPRILIEDDDKSYHAPARRSGDLFDNLLIHGDNLLALKSLEGSHAGRVKCIYIDPPFNTQQALEHYDDGLDHSLWLSLMRERLQVLRELLSDDGTLFIHIDDNELAYLTVLADEIFGRKNRTYIITFKQASATGHKSINPGVVNTTNYILVYAKDKANWKPNKLFSARERDIRYGQFIINKDDPPEHWRVETLMAAFARINDLDVKEGRKIAKENPELLDQFVMDNAESVIQMARPDYDAVGKETKEVIDKSEKHPSKWFVVERSEHPTLYIQAGKRALFYSSKLKLIDGSYVAGEPLTSLWDDILSNNLHNEGGVPFPKSKKPEALIKRCIELTTSPGDIVLDSFAGSGTTGAVAHKLRRRWIMIELKDHCETHIIPRLKRVINGADPSGITDAAKWKGGGGFRYFRIAPSLLEKDQFSQWVISKSYNAEMLAEAMCKHFGFTYAPSADSYWQHGHSSDTDFIYVTTNSLAHDQLRTISDEVGAERTLLICCKAFQGTNADTFANLTIRKIPGAILDRCEWGKDDYSLKIEALPLIEDESESEVAAKPSGRPRKVDDAPSLFDSESDA